MIDRTTKLRWRRNFRRKQRQFEDISSGAEEQLDKHFFRRLGRLYEVRRFIITWLSLIILLLGMTVVQTRALGGYYQTVQPLAGGIYSEGIVGTFTNANPIFATNEVDSSISRLLFSGLMTYNDDNDFVGELATTLDLDGTGKVYTATLRDDLEWDDGKPLTAKDVVFTFQTIQNPDVRSPLFPAWQGVKVTAVSDKIVTFTLTTPLAAFPYALTVGILPEHVLSSIEPSTLRSALFNTTQPVGSGAFKWHGVEVVGNKVEDRVQRVSLSANDKYFKGRPKINEFVLHTYLDEKHMLQDFSGGVLTAVAGVQELSEELKDNPSINEHSLSITGSVMVFMNTTLEPVNNVSIRRGLASATDLQKIILKLSYPSSAVRSPFLQKMIGYDRTVLQRAYGFDEANNNLEAAGWVKGPDGMRAKDGKKLNLNLYTLNSVEYATIAQELQRQWREVGVQLTITSLDQSDLQTVINSRTYQLLLYGISFGVDPDQFAYWHSSQADVLSQRRLNLSNYSSKAADAALEQGRTRTDSALRSAKYRPFLEAWRDDVPAISLYQPHYLYASRTHVYNFDPKAINIPSDRFKNVQNWMIRTERTTNK